MSCFESSTFLKNPQVMNRQVLMDACKKLGWKYEIKQDELIVYNANQNTNLHGEYALKVRGNTFSFNNFYNFQRRSLSTCVPYLFTTFHISFIDHRLAF